MKVSLLLESDYWEIATGKIKRESFSVLIDRETKLDYIFNEFEKKHRLLKMLT